MMIARPSGIRTLGSTPAVSRRWGAERPRRGSENPFASARSFSSAPAGAINCSQQHPILVSPHRQRDCTETHAGHSVHDFMETVKMASTYLAQINPSDYEMIRGILNNDLPDTYQVWLDFQLKGETNLQKRGHTFSHIEIDPGEIARYCGTHGGHRSRHGLLHFVMKKSQGENY
jgi:hypothetical protein